MLLNKLFCVISFLLLTLIGYAALGLEEHVVSIFSTTSLVFIFLIYLYAYHKVFFFISIKFLILFVWVYCSLLYIENGNYVSEQQLWGEKNFSFFRFAVLQIVFLFGAGLTFSSFISFPDTLPSISAMRHFERLVSFLFYVVTGSLFLIGLVRGFPLLIGVARFSYWDGIEYARKLTYLTTIVAFCCGVCLAYFESKKYIGFVVALAGILILFSDKFSGPFSVIQYFIMGYYVFLSVKLGRPVGFSRRVIFVVLPLVFLFLLLSVSVGYLMLSSISPEALYEKIMQRAFGLQGHVWYGTDLLMQGGAEPKGGSLFFQRNEEPDNPAGLIYLMYQISDFDFVQAMRESGIRFTAGFPAIVVICFGYVFSSVVLLFLGAVLGMFFLYLYSKTVQAQFVRLLVALVFFNNIISNVFLMGEVYFIYKVLSLVCVLFIFFDVFFLKGRNISPLILSRDYV